MSGGAFDYLYCRETDELFCHIADLESMKQSLICYGYDDIAKDKQRLIEYVKSARITVETLQDILAPVFKAVEWYESGDYSKGRMIEELEKYRKKETE